MRIRDKRILSNSPKGATEGELSIPPSPLRGSSFRTCLSGVAFPLHVPFCAGDFQLRSYELHTLPGVSPPLRGSWNSWMRAVTGVPLIAPPLPKIRRPSGALGNPTRVQAPNKKEMLNMSKRQTERKVKCSIGANAKT